MSTIIRCLRQGEEDQLLGLLDGWPFDDGWTGREFFRRYLEKDPTYAPRNVVVADVDGRLVACVQIFPRTVRVSRGQSLVKAGLGGIGSVFTHPDYRGAGLAGDLLERAAELMKERGFPISGLLASRVAWYESHDWFELCPYQWRVRRTLVRDTQGSVKKGRRIDIEATGHVNQRSGESVRTDSPLRERLRMLGNSYAASRVGTAVRDKDAWQASWHFAGDPEESVFLHSAIDFGSPEDVDAYLRTTVLYGDVQILEWGRTPDGEEGLASLVSALLADHPSILLARVLDPTVFSLLRERGVTLEQERQASWMFRLLDRSQVLELLEESQGSRLSDRELLCRLLPPSEFQFFMADRF